MQPYFLPYIGYFQLIAAVDCFVIYDTVEYTKKGWVNRNRLLRNHQPVTFTLPLAKGSDFLNICERELAQDFDARKMLAQFEQAYRQAPQFLQVMPVLQDIFGFPDRNLFRFIHHSLKRCCAYLGLETPIVLASEIEGPTHDKAVQRVLALCASLGATRYINPFGGMEMYHPSQFHAHGIDLRFLHSRVPDYPQLGGPFQPNLSIVDVMMFNPRERIAQSLATDYDLIEGKEASDVSVA